MPGYDDKPALTSTNASTRANSSSNCESCWSATRLPWSVKAATSRHGAARHSAFVASTKTCFPDCFSKGGVNGRCAHTMRRHGPGARSRRLGEIRGWIKEGLHPNNFLIQNRLDQRSCCLVEVYRFGGDLSCLTFPFDRLGPVDRMKMEQQLVWNEKRHLWSWGFLNPIRQPW